MLGAPGGLQDVVALACLAPRERGSPARRARVVVRRLDEQPAGMRGAGLGDRPLRGTLARLVQRGREPEPGGQLRGALEAPPVVHLEVQGEGRERVDAAEAAQASDGRPEGILERQLREPLVEDLAAGEKAIDGGQTVEVGELGRRVGEALAGEQRRCACVQVLPS